MGEKGPGFPKPGGVDAMAWAKNREEKALGSAEREQAHSLKEVFTLDEIARKP